MLRIILKSKIHRAHVTGANLNYVGSITIDENLMKQAEIMNNEMVAVVNINNGERFETYVQKGPANSGIISLNGAAARLAQVGDLVIILTYGLYSKEELEKHRPTIVLIGDDKNLEYSVLPKK